jgi:hypothetical protein
MARTHRYAYAGAQKKLRFPRRSLKAISANRYTDRACHPEHFWIAARCAACSHTPSASGCPHRGHQRTSGRSNETSAPLLPRERTSSARPAMSERCQHPVAYLARFQTSTAEPPDEVRATPNFSSSGETLIIDQFWSVSSQFRNELRST